MKRSKFTDAQIIEAIKRVEAGLAAQDISREVGISQADVLQVALNGLRSMDSTVPQNTTLTWLALFSAISLVSPRSLLRISLVARQGVRHATQWRPVPD
ncbi:hypothetical protein KESI111651_16990 [Kerstersia similis]